MSYVGLSYQIHAFLHLQPSPFLHFGQNFNSHFTRTSQPQCSQQSKKPKRPQKIFVIKLQIYQSKISYLTKHIPAHRQITFWSHLRFINSSAPKELAQLKWSWLSRKPKLYWPKNRNKVAREISIRPSRNYRRHFYVPEFFWTLAQAASGIYCIHYHSLNRILLASTSKSEKQ